MPNLSRATLRVKLTRELIRKARSFTQWVWSQHDKALRALAQESQVEADRARAAVLASERAYQEAQRTALHRQEMAEVIARAAEQESEELKLVDRKVL